MQTLVAPSTWRSVELLSDLHLDRALPRTTAAFLQHLYRTEADAVLILGDLFEVWVGDEQAEQALERSCLDAMSRAASRLWLGFMAGNRDFLLSDRILDAIGVHRLTDPVCLEFAGRRYLLSHGDALCLADTAYQAFRRDVRSANWQAAFLARPMAERMDLARRMREQSRSRRSGQVSAPYEDVDADAVIHALQDAGARRLIHGHTHRPGEHDLGAGRRRLVLSDWDLDGGFPRAEVMRLTTDGEQRIEPAVDTALMRGAPSVLRS